MSATRSPGADSATNTLQQQAFTPSLGDFHTYRVEVRGNDIKYSIDGGDLLEATDNRYLKGDRTGIFVKGVQLTVRSFKIVAL